jgi:diguanylate cyclase (GGDEF)-like protein
MSRRTYLIGGWIVGGLVLAAVHLPGRTDRLYAIGIMLATCAGTVLHTVAAIRAHGRARRIWALTAVALACWAYPEVSVGVPTVLTGVAPGRGVLANVVNLGALVLAVAAMLIIPAAPRTTAARLRMLLDGLMTTAALIGVVWQVVLAPMTRIEGSRAALFDLAYPVLAAGVLAVALLLFAGHTGRDAGAMKAITGGVLLLSLSLLTEVVQLVAGLDRLRPWVLDTYLISAVALAVAPLFGLPRGKERVWQPSTTAAGLVPYLPLLGFAVLCVGPTFLGADPDREVVWAGTVMIGAVLGRQFLAIRLNHALTRDLAGQRTRFANEAAHDALTGLPNRARLNRTLAGTGAGGMLLMIDLDGFKAVNDTLGHAAGDELLIVIADRLRAAIAPLGAATTGARLGGDEFAVLLPGDDPAVARDLATTILRTFAEPVALDGRVASVRASIGIAGRAPGRPAARLLHDADLALYEAKSGGKGRYQMFDQALASVVAGRRDLESELGGALAAGQFRLVYRAAVDLGSGVVRAAEADLRWHHPRHGVLEPDAFRAAAADAGVLRELERWELATAVAQLAAWRVADPLFRVGLYLSERYLSGGTLVDDVRHALAAHDLTGTGPGGTGLAVRVAATADVTRLEPALRELRAAGVLVTLDAFGAGHSALTRIRELPVDAIRMDPEFVRDIEHSPEAATLVGAVIALVHSTGRTCVADGVESPAQAGRLVALGCRVAQGPLFGPPTPAAGLTVGGPQPAAVPFFAEAASRTGPLQSA